MRLFDTHAHLLDDRFDKDRNSVAASLNDHGVVLMLEACTNAKDAEAVLAFVDQYPFMVCALGTHPHEASTMNEEDIIKLKRLLLHGRAKAVGEIGLDYHYDFSPRDAQKKWFEAQVELALELNKPAVFHVREAYGDALEILRRHKSGLRGVMHCFSGSYEFARDCLDLGLYIAFGGALTFKNAKKSVEVAQKLPMDRLLIETDCPYMTPEPFRKNRNDPTYVGLVCERLAQIKGMEPEEVALATLKNGCEVFEVSPP